MKLTTEQSTWLKKEMALWRADLRDLPIEYIELHRDAANQTLPALLQELKRTSRDASWVMIDTKLVDAGWMDGMSVLRVRFIDEKENVRYFRWNDSNGGAWFQQHGSGGSSLFLKVGTARY